MERDSSFSHGALVALDRDALVALFRATGGASWKRKQNWDTDAELSAWFGVEVNNQGRVVKLNLEWNNLQGNSNCSINNNYSLCRKSITRSKTHCTIIVVRETSS